MGSLYNVTVVVTGGSSGMGFATALAFARRGANLVLAARRQAPLECAARECEALDGRALAIPTDAADADGMRELAHGAAATFGRIDLWINNAGMSLWGPFESIPLESQARLIEVNLMGVINGSYAVLPHFLRNGGCGIIINMASIGGRVPIPWATTYTASKFAVAGFTDALRYELATHSAIEVCGVYPAFVDTPTNLHSANYMGRALRPVPPVVHPEHVAEQIVGLALRPRRALYVGVTHVVAATFALIPEATGRLVGRLGAHYFLHSGPPAQETEGSLFEPVREGTGVRGGWDIPERTRTKRAAAAALVGLAGVCGFALASSRSARRA
jgi:short-subunit dehydrogenase